jgi:hypothetical protein
MEIRRVKALLTGIKSPSYDWVSLKRQGVAVA